MFYSAGSPKPPADPSGHVDADQWLTDIHAVRDDLAQLCQTLEPSDLVTLEQVQSAYDTVVSIINLAEGAKTRLARRVDETKLWKHSGDNSAAEYLARTSGVGTRAAKNTLDTSHRLRGQEATDDAVKKGQLSPEQANTVSDAAQDDPDSEDDLLNTARTRPLAKLKEHARATKAAADPDPDATTRKIYRNRKMRRWLDAEGGYNLALRTTAMAGAHIDSQLQPLIDQAFNAARRSGRHESHEAYAADALHSLITGNPTPNPDESGSDSNANATESQTTGRTPADSSTTEPPSEDPQEPASQPTRPTSGSHRWRPSPSLGAAAKVLIHIDAAALTRGHLQSGERCHIDGIGDVPVAAVRALLPEAFVAFVIANATDVQAVAHLGRRVTAQQRSALEARGYHCEVPHCIRQNQLQIDHITGWAVTKTTKLDDLAWLCPSHHHDKTHNGWTIAGPPNDRVWRQTASATQRAP